MQIDKVFNGIFWKKLIAVGIGTILLLSIALFNRYPLITQDTAAYLNMAYSWFFPSDRPAFYGIFIRVVSVTNSIWWPAIAQAVLLSFLLVNVIEKFSKSFSIVKTILIIALVVLLTPVTWIVSQLTADIFIAVATLSTVLFYMEKKNWMKVIYGFITYFSLLMHNSNTLSFMCFCFIMLVITLIWHRAYLPTTIKLTLLTGFAFFTLCLSNYFTNKEFTFSSVGHIFFMGKMVESGMLKEFLDENCETANYALCKYKDSLPPYAADFIWQEGKAFHKTGGWHGSKEEYSLIINQTFTTPKYLKMHIEESVFGTVKQVSLTYVGDLLYPFIKGTSPYEYISKLLPNDVEGLVAAKQQQNKLSFTKVSLVYRWALIVGVLALVFLLFTKHIYLMKNYIIVIILLLISNAFVTATFANVIGRLNARVVWILPFWAILFIYAYVKTVREKNHRKN